MNTNQRLPLIPTLGSTLFAVLLLSSSADAQARLYVDSSAAAGSDGSGWSRALRSPSEALELAVAGDEIWVKVGWYTPALPDSPSDPRSASFDIPAGVLMYGGFAGNETSLAGRAGLYEQTVLSGDIGQANNLSDNAYQVVRATNPSGAPPGQTRIDGFTIRDGNADGIGYSAGGGVYMFNALLVLTHCTLRNNHALNGAALHAQPAVALISWCTFENNHAGQRGGAIWGQAINLKVSHSVFRRNHADKGGAVFLNSIFQSVPGQLPVVLMHNSLFHDNHARRGGALFIGASTHSAGRATISNCTLAYNTARESGGGAWAATGAGTPADLDFRSSVIWHNQSNGASNLAGSTTAFGCNIQSGQVTGTRNISLPPLFRNGPQRDLQLSAGSPCIDRGVNALVPHDFLDTNSNGVFAEPQTLDLDRSSRFKGSSSVGNLTTKIDIGAYEFQLSETP